MPYVVKRYSNRKLYDTQESRYVTLEELEELIRAGTEISVVDVSTGEALTSVTLAQIILEKERNHRAALPTAFLHQLIKHGEAWQDFVHKSLKSSLDRHDDPALGARVVRSGRPAAAYFRIRRIRRGRTHIRERIPSMTRSRSVSTSCAGRALEKRRDKYRRGELAAAPKFHIQRALRRTRVVLLEL